MNKATAGSASILFLNDNAQAYPGASVYPAAGDTLERYRDHMTADGKIELNFGCYLVGVDGRRILVDTGWGPENDGRLMKELVDADVSPNDIDTVLFTHLHGDHTGWNIDAQTGRPNFPNARYLVPQGDWEYYSAQTRAGSFAKDVVPLKEAGVLDLISGEHTLSPSLTAIPTPGHTPGHTSLVVSSSGESAVIAGDVLISTVDVEEPQLQCSFDNDHDLARATRLGMLDRLEREGSLLAASHLPNPGFGRIVRVEGRRFWRPEPPK